MYVHLILHHGENACVHWSSHTTLQFVCDQPELLSAFAFSINDLGLVT